MIKPSTKCGKGTTALPTRKSSQNLVDASKGKTNPRTQGAAINKKSPIMHSWSLSTDTPVPKASQTRSSSIKDMAIASKAGSNSGAGDTPVTGWISHFR